MILAAGRGTRLASMGLNVPKALVEIGGRPLLESQIDYLVRSGIERIVVMPAPTSRPDSRVLAEAVKHDQSLAFALDKMDIGCYRNMAMVQDGVPLGVLSVRDLLRHITGVCKER